jgi:hypothetical protein
MKSKIKHLTFVLVAALVGVVEVANAFYDPGLQRWINRDPLGDIASLPVMTAGIAPWSESDSAGEMGAGEFFEAWTDINRNLNGAMGNNPLNFRDSWGLCGEEEAANAAEKAADIVKETLQKANDFAQKTARDAREAWGKNNSMEAERFEKQARSAAEQARKLMEEYQIKKGRAAELREAANAAKASRFWPRAGRFLKGAGEILITIPARIPMMFMPIWQDPDYCRNNMASVDSKANSGESSPENQLLETKAGRIEEQHEGEHDFNGATKQIGDVVGTKTNSWVLVSAK